MFTAVIHEEDGIFVAECPEIGSVSQGKTAEEALCNLREATELSLEAFPHMDKKKSMIRTFDLAHT